MAQPEHKDVIKTVAKFKSHKVPGEDKIPSELLKVRGEVLHQNVHKIVCLR